MRPVTDLERRVSPFRVISDFTPSGDQPQAIDELERRIRAGEPDVVTSVITSTAATRIRMTTASPAGTSQRALP